MQPGIVIGVRALLVTVMEIIKALPNLRNTPHHRQALRPAHAAHRRAHLLRHGQRLPARKPRQPLRQSVRLHHREGLAVPVEAAVAVLELEQRPPGQVQPHRLAHAGQLPALSAAAGQGARHREYHQRQG